MSACLSLSNSVGGHCDFDVCYVENVEADIKLFLFLVIMICKAYQSHQWGLMR